MTSLKNLGKKAFSLAGLFLVAAGVASAQSGGGSFNAPITYNNQQVGTVSGYYTYSTIQCGPNVTFAEYFYYPEVWQLTPPSSPAHDPSGWGLFSQPPQMTYFTSPTGNGNGAGCPGSGYQGGYYNIAFEPSTSGNSGSGTLSCFNSSGTLEGVTSTNMNNGSIMIANPQIGLSPSFTVTSFPYPGNPPTIPTGTCMFY